MMFHLKLRYVFAFALAVSISQMSAQTSGSGGTGSTGGGGGRGGTTGGTTTVTRPPIQRNPNSIFNQENNRPVFIGGRVMIDDGSPLPESVPIQRVCGNSVRREGYTDSGGHFSFLLSNTTSTFQDASESAPVMGAGPSLGTVNVRQLWSCEIRAYLAGFMSSSISLAGRSIEDMQNLGVISLHRNVGIGAGSVSITTLKAPSNARKAYEKANNSFSKGKFEDADKWSKKATDEYPEYALAWDLRGQVQEHLQKSEDAEKSYELAIRSDSKLVPPYLRLALIHATKQQWDDVLQLTARALEADPVNYPLTYFLNAAAYYNKGDLEKAEHRAMRAIALDKQHLVPRAELLAASIYTKKGNPEAAIPHLEEFVKLQPNAAESAKIQKYLADMAGKSQHAKQP